MPSSRSARISGYNSGAIPVISVTSNRVTAISASPANAGDTWLTFDSDMPRAIVGGSYVGYPSVYVNVSSRPPRPVSLRLTPAAETLTRQGEPLYFTAVETLEGGVEKDVTSYAVLSNSANRCDTIVSGSSDWRSGGNF